MAKPRPILKNKVSAIVPTPDVQIDCDDAGDNIYYISTVNHWDTVKLFFEYHNISYETVQVQGKLYQTPTSFIKYEFNFLRTFSTWLITKGLSCSVNLSSVQD